MGVLNGLEAVVFEEAAEAESGCRILALVSGVPLTRRLRAAKASAASALATACCAANGT
jgi:hypothetical protein